MIRIIMTQIFKKTTLIIAAILLALTAAYFVYLKASDSTMDNGLGRHKTGALTALQFPKEDIFAPETPFTDKNGANHTITEFKGKVVIVNMWATWCPPCIREMPSLGRLRKLYAPKDLEILAISTDKKADISKAEKKLGDLTTGSLPFYSDATMNFASSVNVAGFPTTIIYDRQGKEIARLSGTAQWDSQDVKDLIDDVLK